MKITKKELLQIISNVVERESMKQKIIISSGSNLLTILEKGSDEAIQVIDTRTNKIIRGDIGYRDAKNKTVDVEFTLKNPSGSLSRKYLTFTFDGNDFKSSNGRYKLKTYE